ncbi:cobalamin B12-binding domain-containing protein [Methanosphaerula palustris]|uniref:Cobalamin B12-binding domain protein n=1 Tax=Methanosphaerula palustris (strain ATCC BAA-1556 / DSM 19958 / E1-9c) TaxID=521011 RepID=B8GHN3_METPE|nr:cobalamin-dependent protein [Methanosphaerula palustris]ACL16638.1 cobalamin B12-binding domain protein [Methanosphaerula palustris E1-9c]
MRDPSVNLLVEYLIEGDRKRSLSEAKRLLDAHVEREKIIIDGVEMAMKRLETKCTIEQFNLLEIMIAGRAAMEVVNYLYPPDSPRHNTEGTVVIGTPEGDVHDLGKNILKMVLTAEGYQVVDCGKDCPLDLMADAVKREGALAICISGLITPMIPLVRQMKTKLAERGMMNVKVIAGGAALRQATAKSLNVDFVADTAFDVSGYLKETAGENDEQH